MPAISAIMLCVCAGMCLGGAFWIYGDGVVAYHFVQKQPLAYEFKWAVPGLLISVAVIALNLGVSPSSVIQHWEARLWAFCCLTLAFLGIGLALWILVADEHIGGGANWASISILLQTMLVMVAGILFFVRDGTSKTNSY